GYPWWHAMLDLWQHQPRRYGQDSGASRNRSDCQLFGKQLAAQTKKITDAIRRMSEKLEKLVYTLPEAIRSYKWPRSLAFSDYATGLSSCISCISTLNFIRYEKDKSAFKRKKSNFLQL